jgi:hypothetical protein
MALVLLNNTGNPFGQFDGYDGMTATMLGGEVAQLLSVQLASTTDKSVKDIADGYVTQGGGLTTRPVASATFASGQNANRPLFLTDDGTLGYGTLFGVVVGGVGGQQVTGGAVLGPSTMTGSGKVTLWQNTGMYGVTLDALDTAADGTVPANNTLSVGAALTWGANGKLTPVGSTLAGAFPGGANSVVAARLIEFSTGDGLVNTPKSLTRVGVAGGMLQFKYAIINFNPPV